MLYSSFIILIIAGITSISLASVVYVAARWILPKCETLVIAPRK